MHIYHKDNKYMWFMDIWRQPDTFICWYIFYHQDTKQFKTAKNEQQAIDIMQELQKTYDKKLNIITCNLEISGANLINYMLRNGWIYSDKVEDGKQFFKAFITDNDMYYSLDLYFSSRGGGKKVKAVSIRDFNMLINNFKGYADEHKQVFTGLQIDNSDIMPYKPCGLSALPTDAFIETCRNLMYLSKANEILTDKLHCHSYSIGSCAFKQYTNILNRYGRAFETFFPKLDAEINKHLRLAYAGGINTIYNGYRGKIIDDIRVIDINSIYANALKNELMPIGSPLKFEGKYDNKFSRKYPLYVQFVSVSGWRLKDGHFDSLYFTGLPMFKVSESEERRLCREGDGDYTKEYHGFVTLCLTNLDLQTLLDNYNVFNLKYNGGYMFKGKHGLFTKYVDRWDKVKIQCRKNGRKIMGDISKKMQVTLYGKFGQKETAYHMIPYLDTDYKNIDDCVLTFKRAKEQCEPKYLPIALFTTAYARRQLVTAATVWQDTTKLVYCDTDSLHFTGYLPKPYKIRKTNNTELTDRYISVGEELGQFKFEGYFTRGVYHDCKCYTLEREDGTNKTVIAGLPLNNHGGVTVDNLKAGLCIGYGCNVMMPQGKVFVDGLVYEIPSYKPKTYKY